MFGKDSLEMILDVSKGYFGKGTFEWIVWRGYWILWKGYIGKDGFERILWKGYVVLRKGYFGKDLTK